MGSRVEMRTERQVIFQSGISQVLTTSQEETWSVEIFAEAENAGPIFLGNDGNSTVAANTGVLLYPTDIRVFSSRDFFSAYDTYVNMSKIFVLGTQGDGYRLLYWTGSAP
jgi:hypothetical protein